MILAHVFIYVLKIILDFFTEDTSLDLKGDESTSAIITKDDKQQEEELCVANGASPKEQINNTSVDNNETSNDALENTKENLVNCKIPNESEVYVKIEKDTSSTCEETPILCEDQKELTMEVDPHREDEACASSESETSIRDNSTVDSEEGRMEVDLPVTDVKAEVWLSLTPIVVLFSFGTSQLV